WRQWPDPGLAHRDRTGVVEAPCAAPLPEMQQALGTCAGDHRVCGMDVRGHCDHALRTGQPLARFLACRRRPGVLLGCGLGLDAPAKRVHDRRIRHMSTWKDRLKYGLPRLAVILHDLVMVW